LSSALRLKRINALASNRPIHLRTLNSILLIIARLKISSEISINKNCCNAYGKIRNCGDENGSAHASERKQDEARYERSQDSASQIAGVETRNSRFVAKRRAQKRSRKDRQSRAHQNRRR